MGTDVPTPGETRSLTELERVIAVNLTDSVLHLGLALKEIRDSRLYREAGYDAFDRYLGERWDQSRRWAYNQIDAADVLCAIAHVEQQPMTESQARELVPVLRSEGSEGVAEVWQRIVAEAEGPITARRIREYVRPDEPDGRLTPSAPIVEPEDHLRLVWVECTFGYPLAKGQDAEGRRQEWHSGRLYLPDDIAMPETTAEIGPLMQAQASSVAKMLYLSPPKTARWKVA
jgi:hypothetical protein